MFVVATTAVVAVTDEPAVMVVPVIIDAIISAPHQRAAVRCLQQASEHILQQSQGMTLDDHQAIRAKQLEQSALVEVEEVSKQDHS
jgi:hypothetical protein